MCRIRRRFRGAIGRCSGWLEVGRGNLSGPSGKEWCGMSRDGWDARDVEELLRLGLEMKKRPELVFAMAEELLRVRDRAGLMQPLRANAVQRAFEKERGQRNIVLKARQMGVTTWIAARVFLKTITERGVLTVQVAHTREAAEGIF